MRVSQLLAFYQILMNNGFKTQSISDLKESDRILC